VRVEKQESRIKNQEARSKKQEAGEEIVAVAVGDRLCVH